MNLAQINSKSCSDDRNSNYELMCWLTIRKIGCDTCKLVKNLKKFLLKQDETIKVQ